MFAIYLIWQWHSPFLNVLRSLNVHPINQPKLIYSNSACAKIDCSTIDFSNVLSVVDGLCTACVGTNTEDCTLATCSDGYWMYLNGANAINRYLRPLQCVLRVWET